MYKDGTLTDIYESPNFNPEHHDFPFSIPFMKPEPSKNIFIRIMDFMCSCAPGIPYFTPWIMLLAGFTIFWAIFILTDVFFALDIVIHDYEDGEFQFLFILCLMFSQTLRFDIIYRHYRNKYLREHLLPGPNGWCSIDCGHPYTVNKPI